MFDLLTLIGVLMAFAGAAGYIWACADLTRAPGNGAGKHE